MKEEQYERLLFESIYFVLVSALAWLILSELCKVYCVPIVSHALGAAYFVNTIIFLTSAYNNACGEHESKDSWRAIAFYAIFSAFSVSIAVGFAIQLINTATSAREQQ